MVTEDCVILLLCIMHCNDIFRGLEFCAVQSMFTAGCVRNPNCRALVHALTTHLVDESDCSRAINSEDGNAKTCKLDGRENDLTVFRTKNRVPEVSVRIFLNHYPSAPFCPNKLLHHMYQSKRSSTHSRMVISLLCTDNR